MYGWRVAHHCTYTHTHTETERSSAFGYIIVHIICIYIYIHGSKYTGSNAPMTNNLDIAPTFFLAEIKAFIVCSSYSCYIDDDEFVFVFHRVFHIFFTFAAYFFLALSNILLDRNSNMYMNAPESTLKLSNQNPRTITYYYFTCRSSTNIMSVKEWWYTYNCDDHFNFKCSWYFRRRPQIRHSMFYIIYLANIEIIHIYIYIRIIYIHI